MRMRRDDSRHKSIRIMNLTLLFFAKEKESNRPKYICRTCRPYQSTTVYQPISTSSPHILDLRSDMANFTKGSLGLLLIWCEEIPCGLCWTNSYSTYIRIAQLA